MKEININKVNEKIYYDKCDNGLEIYMWINEHVNDYFATLNVKYGSLDTNFKIKNKEYKVPNGTAHFLEHINFNEKDGKTAHDYFNKLGTSINAFTTFDYTCYEIFGTTNLISNVNHLLDYVETPIITDELVQKEKGIIIEEVKMGDNNPGRKMYFGTNRAVFHKNHRIYEVTGNVDDVNSISTEDLNLAYDNFYHPSNMFIIITGNFNPYEMACAIKENQNNKNYPIYHMPKIINEKEDISVVKEYSEIEGKIEIPKINVVYKLAKNNFKEFSDADIRIYLRIIMNANFGPTSELKEDLMEKELITGMGNSVEIVDNIIMITISAETRYPNELIKIIKENMATLSITKERLNRRIKCNIASLIASFDDIEEVNYNIQDDLLTYKKIENNIYDNYKTINIESAELFIKKLDFKNCAVVVELPEKDTK